MYDTVFITLLACDAVVQNSFRCQMASKKCRKKGKIKYTNVLNWTPRYEGTWKCGNIIPRKLHLVHVHALISVYKVLTYLLTPWSRVLLEKLICSQLVKKFPAFFGIRRFITTFTSVRHLSISWATSIQSMPSHPTPWRSILIWLSHTRLLYQITIDKFTLILISHHFIKAMRHSSMFQPLKSHLWVV